MHKTPLWEALKAHIGRGGYPLHVPGHKQGRGLPADFRDDMSRADVTELPGLDNLYEPTGPLLMAEDLASKLVGSTFCHFTTNGASSALVAAILALTREQRRVLLPRNAHVACVHACVLGDLVPIFTNVQIDPVTGVVLGVDGKDFAQKLRSEVGAAVVVHPTYQGICGDIATIAAECARAEVPLIVDEAHGSHFFLGGPLPPSGISAGATAVVHSVHKTGLAMTGAAWIHGMRASDNEPVKRSLRLMQSTSPSYLLLASLDLSRFLMQTEGLARLLQAIEAAQAIRQVVHTYQPPLGYRHDPLRVVVNAQAYGTTGYELERRLGSVGVFCEMADASTLTLVMGLADGEEALQCAIPALKATLRNGFQATPAAVSHVLPPLGHQVLTPREAYFANYEWCSPEKSLGRIAVDSLTVYPPGVPLIWPGQRIERDVIEYIIEARKKGVTVTGLCDNCIKVVK